MLDFELTEDQLSVEKMVRDFAAKEVAPRIQELDSKHQFDSGVHTGDRGVLQYAPT